MFERLELSEGGGCYGKSALLLFFHCFSEDRALVFTTLNIYIYIWDTVTLIVVHYRVDRAPSSHLAAGGPHTNTLSNRVKNGKDRGFPGRVEDLEVDPGWGVGCPAVESSQFCAGHPRSDFRHPDSTGSNRVCRVNLVRRIIPGRAGQPGSVSRVGRVIPGRAGQPGLPGQPGITWVIPGRSGYPELFG